MKSEATLTFSPAPKCCWECPVCEKSAPNPYCKGLEPRIVWIDPYSKKRDNDCPLIIRREES